MITVLVDMILSKLLHTEDRSIALLTSSVIIPIEAICAHPQTAMVAGMIDVIIAMHIVKLIAPNDLYSAIVTDGVLIFVNVSCAGHLVFTHITDAIVILVYTRDAIPAHITRTVAVFVCTHIVETSTADCTFM